jgi:translocation and assembly module TamB
MSTNRRQLPFEEEPRQRRPWTPAPIQRHRHLIAWVTAVFTFLPIILLVAVLALINNDGVHRYLLSLIQREASKSLGVQVQLQDFLLHYRTLSVDLYGLRAAGAAPYSNPPLLTVDHVNAGVRIVSILSRKWYLDNIEIDHPVAWITVDKNGVTNIPAPKSSGKSNTDIFQLGIRHFHLSRGEVYYNSQPSALAADLHNVDFASSFNSALTKYTGELAYKNGQLKYGDFAPLNHDLDVKFDATPDVFTLNSGTIAIGDSHLSLNASASQYRTNPVVQAHYDVVADGAQWAKILKQPMVPLGAVRAAGTVSFQRLANQTILDAIQVEGDLTSNRLDFNTPSIHSAVQNFAAHYSLNHGNAALSYLRAQILGGELTGRGTMQSISGNSHSDFQVELKNVSLPAVKSAIPASSATRNFDLAGTASATAHATWGKTMDDLIVKSDANLSAAISKTAQSRSPQLTQVATAAPPQSPIPVEGVVHGTYLNSGQELSLRDSYVRSLGTNLNMNGTVSKRSALQVSLQVNDLREILPWIAMFSADGKAPANADIAGSAKFDGSVRGSLSDPHITGQLNAQNLHANGTDWTFLRSGVDVSSSHAALSNAELQSATRGRVTLNANLGLKNWSPDERAPAQVDLNASQLDLATLARAAGQSQPITGSLNAVLHMHGSIDDPAGEGNITLNQASFADQPIDVARVDLTGSGGEARANLNVRIPAGAVTGQVSVRPREKTFKAELDSRGIDLAKIKALQERGVNLKGSVDSHVTGQGSFNNPEANAAILIRSVTYSGHELSNAKLDLNLKNHLADVQLNAAVDKLPMNAKAHINLAGDYMTDASLDTPQLPLEPLLAAYASGDAGTLTGTTELHATLHGPLKDTARLEAHVTVPVLKLAYGNSIQLAAASPIHLDYANGVANLKPARFSGTDTNLQIEGDVPVKSNAPMSLKAHGTVDLQIAQVFSPGLRSSGQLRLNIDASKVGPGQTLGGEIDLVNANLASADLPVGLRNANGVFKLKTDRLEIASFQGEMGGGTLNAQGALVYRPQVQFDLGVTAKGVRMLYPEGVRETVDGNLRLAGTTEKATLGGTVKLADLSFTQAFDIDTLIGSFSGGVSAPSGPGFAQNLALNIAVNSANRVNLVSRTLSVDGTAALQVRGTAADPVLLGRVNLNGGDVILHGDRFVLSGGTIQFINPSVTEPILNVSISTTIQEYKINMRFNGPAAQLQTQYTSDPALPAADIIHLLAFGSTTEASANATNNPTVSQQAESLVASQVSSQVTSRLSKAAGISQLSISPVLSGSTTSGPPGAQITIRQRVTGNLFVTFSTNVASTQGETIQGQYQVTPRVAVSATRSPNGGMAVDTLIKKTW